ncbi:hypothetical protein MKW98_013472 [Papaver atlanticum]|uniref:Peptidase A1 domain-containing protein n=1 Tax=Papaver atlanticum TaxID=357466 RepID=A0AAD4SVS9_9MAGN|nr:hypothetical protein MKW98_013472 [Papaver atlanticum]
MASFSPIHQSSSASSVVIFSAITFLLFIASFSNAQPVSSSRPQGVVLAVTKDASTLQYLINIKQGTPLVSESLVVDLAGEYLWVDCDEGYVSSSNRTINCLGSECLKLQSNSKSCQRKPAQPGHKSFLACIVFPRSKLFDIGLFREYFNSDFVSTQSCINGSSTGPNVTVRKFSFGCASTSLLTGLAKGVKGSAGFGPFGVSVPSQLSLALRIPRVFAMCLPSTTSSKGVIFVGGGPYKIQPGIDISTFLTYTPFYTKTNAFSNSEYYVQVTSINIGGEKILLDLNRGEYPSPKLATIDTLIPYTLIGTSIYNQFTSIFIEKAKAMNITRVASVAPFDVCFDSTNMISTRVGGLVPTINIVLHRENVVWKIFGSNSMVKVSEEVSCLGFVDGGRNPSNMLVIGGYQLQDNLLEFNLAKKRLGFTSTLGRQTTCSNFNFQ